jgi:prepilin-type N-terminal cleavage/methylation domain-containing protein
MARRTSKTPRPHAFTLIELVIVVSAIAVLSLIAIPRYANSMNRYRVDLAAKRVVADFALARSAARASGTGQVVDFSTPANGYTLTGLESPDTHSGSYVVKLSEEPFKVTVTSASFGSPMGTSLRFTRFGTPETAGGSVVVGLGGYTRTIVVDSVTGRAEVQ